MISRVSQATGKPQRGGSKEKRIQTKGRFLTYAKCCCLVSRIYSCFIFHDILFCFITSLFSHLEGKLLEVSSNVSSLSMVSTAPLPGRTETLFTTYFWEMEEAVSIQIYDAALQRTISNCHESDSLLNNV